VVQEAWNRDTPHNLNHLTMLHVKLGRVAKALRRWSTKLMPRTKVIMAVCREVIEQLQGAQESKQLAMGEILLIQTLKSKLLGLAAIEKSRARQKSRITWLKKGDANIRYFQLMANIRKKNNFIFCLANRGGHGHQSIGQAGHYV
jgi:hypothetical protein